MQPLSVADGTTLKVNAQVATGTSVYTLTFKDAAGNVVSKFDTRFYAVCISGANVDLAIIAVGDTATVITKHGKGQLISNYSEAKKIAKFELVTRNGNVTINDYTIKDDGSIEASVARDKAGTDYLRFAITFADGTATYQNIGKIR